MSFYRVGFKCVGVILLSLLLWQCSKINEVWEDIKQVKTDDWYVRQIKKGVPQRWQLEKEWENSGNGIYEVTQYPAQKPTKKQIKEASQFRQQVIQAVINKGWKNRDAALGSGYEKMYGDPVHYVNKAYLFDHRELDPERPEFLIYYQDKDSGRYILMGVMFISEKHGRQLAGPLTVWHFHTQSHTCYENGLLPIGDLNDKGQCKEGATRKRSPEMLHLWFFNHPDGTFASRMWLSESEFQDAKTEANANLK